MTIAVTITEHEWARDAVCIGLFCPFCDHYIKYGIYKHCFTNWNIDCVKCLRTILIANLNT